MEVRNRIRCAVSLGAGYTRLGSTGYGLEMFCERIFQKAPGNGRKTKKITKTGYSSKYPGNFVTLFWAGNAT